jgi:hypothetical protein
METENKIYKKPKRYTIRRSKELINHTSNRIRGTKKKHIIICKRKVLKFSFGGRGRERERESCRNCGRDVSGRG